MNRQAEADKKQIEELSRARDVLSKKIISASEQSDVYQEMLKVWTVNRRLFVVHIAVADAREHSEAS